jgi:hypothetical protein
VTQSSHSELPLPHLILKFTLCFVHIFLTYCIFFFFLFFFLFRIAVQWHNLQIVEVGHYSVKVEVEEQRLVGSESE